MNAVVNTLILVPCCGPKLAHPAPAQDLYQSQLFKLSRQYAEQSGHPWAILSAKYHVVRPDQVIEPYDMRVPTRHVERAHWGSQASTMLLALTAGKPTRFVNLCGRDYACCLDPLLGECRSGAYFPSGNVLEDPLRGLGIGLRLQWLGRAVSERPMQRQPPTIEPARQRGG